MRQGLFAVYAPRGIGEATITRHLEDIARTLRLFPPDARVQALTVHAAG